MMNYTRSKTPSMGTPSVYSHVTGRSSAGLRSSRSTKSLKIPWYRKAILQDAIFLDVQRGSMMVAFYSVFLSLFTIATAIFDLYCYGMAVPGSIHYGYFIMSFEFIYVGNTHVRNCLIVMALFSLLSAMAVFASSFILIFALRKEHEQKIIPWLWAFAIFTIIRLLAHLFFSIVNDLYFGYNTAMCVLWSFFIIANVYGWLLVYSLFIELCNLSKLADIAKLRMGTMNSLNASTAGSLAGSRPTTPHSTVSTAPVS